MTSFLLSSNFASTHRLVSASSEQDQIAWTTESLSELEAKWGTDVKRSQQFPGAAGD